MKFLALPYYIKIVPFIFLMSCSSLRNGKSIEQNYAKTDISYWNQKFNEVKKQKNQLNFELSSSNDSWSHYKLAGGVDALNAIFLATGDLSYLRENIEIVKKVIQTAQISRTQSKSQFKDNFLGWTNKSHSEKENDGLEYPLYESYLWRYVSSLIYIIYNKGYHVDNEFEADYDLLLNFTETNIFKKWQKRGDHHLYRINTNMSAIWAHISLNLWLVTGKQKYKELYTSFNKKFSDHIVKISNGEGTLFWNSYWEAKYDKHNFGQDVSHANAEIAYIIDCYDNDIFFKKDFMKSLINTFQKVVWIDKSRSSYYLDGSGNGKFRFVDGFMKLGRYDQSLSNRLINHSFTGESVYYRSDQFYANNALNLYLLNVLK